MRPRFDASRNDTPFFSEHSLERGPRESLASVFNCDTRAETPSRQLVRAIAENMREYELTRGATRRVLKPSRGGVLVLRSTGTGRAEAERTLSILWDSAGPRVCGTRGERGTGRGPQASAGRARKEERASERARAASVRVTLRRYQYARELPSSPEILLLSLSLAPLDIFIFVSNTCGVSRPDASRRGPHRRNTRGPVPRMRAPR